MEREHKLKADYGMPDYYSYFNKHSNVKVSKTIYNKIITEFNLSIIDLMLNHNFIYYIPILNMDLIVKKDKRKPRLVNGKLINNIPIDWQKTNQLWERDPEAKSKKLLVRYNNSHTSGFVFRLFLNKFRSTVKNKSLFKLKANRLFQRSLSKRIKDINKNPFDSYLLY
jgi:hypothetical protein